MAAKGHSCQHGERPLVLYLSHGSEAVLAVVEGACLCRLA